MSSIDLRLALPDTAQIVGDSPVMVKCREHKDKQASLAVYPDGLFCFGCAFRMQANVRAALAYLLKTDDFDEAKYTSASVDAYRERATAEAKRTPLPAALADAYATLLHTVREERLGWLLHRGLTPYAIKQAKLGHNGFAFTIPVFDAQGNLLTFRFRRDEAYSSERGPKYWGVPGRNGQYVYPEHFLTSNPFTCLAVCEGELDALRLWQVGVPALTLTNGAGQTPKLPALVRAQFPQIESLVIVTDMDEAGHTAASLTAEAAVALGLRVTRASWPLEEGKDVSEWLAQGHRWNEADFTPYVARHE